MVLIEEIPDKKPAEPRKVTFKDEPLAAKSNGKVLILPIVIFHATLVALVRYQYGQEVELKMIIKESWMSIPVFWALFHYVHPYLATQTGQICTCLASIVGACYLVHIANDLGYYAVMQKAPPVGSLVVWGFIELSILWSFVVVIAVAVFMWIYSYSL